MRLTRWSLGWFEASVVDDLCVPAVSSLEGTDGIQSPSSHLIF